MAFYVIYTPLLHGLSSLTLIQECFDKRKTKCRLWIPMQTVTKTRYNNKIEVQVPMFPNYCLVDTVLPLGAEQEMEQALLDLKAGYFLKYPGSTLPAEISEKEIKIIEELQSKEVKEIQKEEKYTPIEIGTYVEVTTTHLKGVVVESTQDTVTIETYVFGRSAPVEVPISALSRSTPVSQSVSTKTV